MPILLLSCEKEPLLLIFWNDIVIFLIILSPFRKKIKMSATDQMRQMLDQLMGTQRNGK